MTSGYSVFVDPTMMPGQPELFVLVKSDSFTILEGGRYVKPGKILEAEAWVDGVQQKTVREALLKYASEETLATLGY